MHQGYSHNGYAIDKEKDETKFHILNSDEMEMYWRTSIMRNVV